jgi:hypothetical protein
MANTISPFGFRSFGQREGSAPTAGQERLFINSSDTNTYFTGDLVYLSSTPAGAGGQNFPAAISLSSQSGFPAGVFNGCKYYSPTVGRTVWNNYFPGSVGSSNVCEAFVMTNPQQLFLAQCSTTSGVCGTSNIGMNIATASSLQISGNILSGQSQAMLASSNVGFMASSAAYPPGSALANWKVVDVYANSAPPGVNGTSSGAEGGAILIVSPGNWSRNIVTTAST